MAAILTQLDQFSLAERSNILDLANKGYSIRFMLELRDVLVEFYSQHNDAYILGDELFHQYIDLYLEQVNKVGTQVVQDWEEFYPIWDVDGEFTGTDIQYCAPNYVGSYDSLESFISHNPDCDECDYIISNKSVFYSNW